MNDWEDLENRLRSWTPRPPSPKLEERLFGGRAADAVPARAASRSAFGAWHWLAPATAVCVMVLTFMGPTSRSFTHLIMAPSSSVVASLALRQPGLSTYYGAADHSGRNTWPVATFEWTNRNRSLTTAGSLGEVWETNSLFR